MSKMGCGFCRRKYGMDKTIWKKISNYPVSEVEEENHEANDSKGR